MKKNIKIVLSSAALLLIVGCANKSHYHWGEYEAIIHDMYVEPGSEDPTTQIQKLTQDIQEAESLGKPVPPGIYAHLGFMYAIKGDVELSNDAFNKEKALYPESKVFVDGMLERASQNNKVVTHAQ